MFDPLVQYHTLLRASRASGYPNMQNFAPHPMQLSQAFLSRYPMFNQGVMRDMSGRGQHKGRNTMMGQYRIPVQQSYRQGIANRGPYGPLPIPGMQ